MSIFLQNEDTLEEMWRIKKELSTQHKSWSEYVASLMSFQEEERKKGVRIWLPNSHVASV